METDPFERHFNVYYLFSYFFFLFLFISPSYLLPIDRKTNPLPYFHLRISASPVRHVLVTENQRVRHFSPLPPLCEMSPCEWVEIAVRNCFDQPFHGLEQISCRSIGIAQILVHFTPPCSHHPRAQPCPSLRQRILAQFHVDHQDHRRSSGH